jgi:hypothetical protein
VQEALKDTNFRRSLPPELNEDIIKYEKNPSCPCNLPIYRNILKFASQQLKDRYPNQEVVNPDIELPPLVKNNWSVINCNIEQLENKLKELGVGRLQIAIARWEDQVTVIVNEMDSYI